MPSSRCRNLPSEAPVVAAVARWSGRALSGARDDTRRPVEPLGAATGRATSETIARGSKYLVLVVVFWRQLVCGHVHTASSSIGRDANYRAVSRSSASQCEGNSFSVQTPTLPCQRGGPVHTLEPRGFHHQFMALTRVRAPQLVRFSPPTP